MESPRLLFPSSPSSEQFHQTTKNFSAPNPISIETQTESIKKKSTDEVIHPLKEHSQKEQFQKQYERALRFLNRCHKLMNEMIEENFKHCGDLKPDNYMRFALPEIPNYFLIFHLLLQKCKHNLERPKKGKPAEKERPVDGKLQNHSSEISELEEFNQWLDQTIISNEKFIKRTSSETDDTVSHPDTPELPNDKSSFHIKTDNEDDEKDRPSSEVDVEYTYSLREVPPKIQLTKENQTDKFCTKLNEHIHKNEKHNKLTELIRRQVKAQVSNCLRKPTKKQKNSQETPFVQESFPVIDIQPQVNLFEYAKARTETVEVFPKNDVQIVNFAAANYISTTKDAEFQSPNVLPLKLKRSNTNVVNEMFRKVSQENVMGYCNPADGKDNITTRPVKVSQDNVISYYMRTSKDNTTRSTEMSQAYVVGHFNSDSNDNNVIPGRVVSEVDTLIYNNQGGRGNTVRHSKPTNPLTLKAPRKEDTACQDDSDSDSIILDDEEFQKINNRTSSSSHNDSNKEKPKCFGSSFIANYSKAQKGTVIERSKKQEEKSKPLTKLHPLQLSDKDLSQLDDKVIKDIGLFTEGGNFRPGIINVLQEKQRSVDSNKNKQFRTKRKIHIEVNFTRSSANLGDIGDTSSDCSDACELQSSLSFCSDLKNEEDNSNL